MKYEFEIPGTLPNLNDYINACRKNRYMGAKMKRDAEEIAAASVRKALRGLRLHEPVNLAYEWAEPNRKRDKDNVAGFGMKVIQDALVRCGIIPDDGWEYVQGFRHTFRVDKKRPHITVIIETVTD